MAKKLPEGKKSRAHSEKLRLGFMEIYTNSGTSIYDAAKKMGTSTVTAQKYFLQCADVIAQANHVKNETWLDKRDRVINRAMEGYTKRTNEAILSKIRIGTLLAVEYQKYIELSKQGVELIAEMKSLGKQIEQTKDQNTLKELLKEQKTLTRAFQIGRETFSATLNQIAYIEKQFNETQQFIVSLQEKYDSMDAKPPAESILRAELELYHEEKKELMFHA